VGPGHCLPSPGGNDPRYQSHQDDEMAQVLQSMYDLIQSTVVSNTCGWVPEVRSHLDINIYCLSKPVPFHHGGMEVGMELHRLFESDVPC
jgi:hypothetical protein